MEFFIVIWLMFAAWVLTYKYFYSPKAHVERLWKEVFIITSKVAEQKKVSGDDYDSLTMEYKKIISKKKKMINAILDYSFDPEEDEEYLYENRP